MLNSLNFRVIVLSALLGFIGITLPGGLFAQSPPGPLPQAEPQPRQSAGPSSVQPKNQEPPRKTIMGFWKLNTDESDDPRKKSGDARGANGGNGGGGRRQGGIYFPGGRVGGYGGHRRNAENGESLRDLIVPANSLNLAQKDAEIDMTDDRSRKVIFFTDGRKIEKSKNEQVQQAAAHWDGNRLVSEGKTPHDGKISRSFELAENGRQIYETLSIETPRAKFPRTERYVYDAAPQAASQE